MKTLNQTNKDIQMRKVKAGFSNLQEYYARFP